MVESRSEALVIQQFVAVIQPVAFHLETSEQRGKRVLFQHGSGGREKENSEELLQKSRGSMTMVAVKSEEGVHLLALHTHLSII